MGLGLCTACLAATPAGAATWRIEAEQLLADDPAAEAPWTAQADENASGGTVLGGATGHNLPESPGLPIRFERPGSYWLWVRYQRPQDDAFSSFYTLVRDNLGEGIALGKLDFHPHSEQPTERPYAPFTLQSRDNTSPGDFIWEKLPVVVERPMQASASFGGLIGGKKVAPRRIDCVIVTDDPAYRPHADDAWRRVPPQPEASTAGPLTQADPPGDMQTAAGFPMHASFFAGVDDAAGQFHMEVASNSWIYPDYARVLQLGFNRISLRGGDLEKGIWTMGILDVFDRMDPEMVKKYPSPEGRFVNAQGEVGRIWSLHFEPVRQTLLERTRARYEMYADNPVVESFRIVAETGGQLDYSEPAQQAFRRWLAERHASIADLNALWGTSYGGFEEVVPPADAAENKAGWFAFREFSGETFAQVVAEQAAAAREVDPKDRMLIGQSSNLDLLAAQMTSLRPMDWEQFIEVALAEEGHVGWDSYCADDYMGCEVDLLHSLAGGRALINKEWNPHATDWRIAARTFWTMIGKGVQGIQTFQLQEGTYHNSYPKWAMWNHDFTPKEKLGAIADAGHEVHRLERLVMSAKPAEPVKPVALYYSRLDLSLAQPLASAWGEQVDTPYHVYRTLRGMGYAVRWITPRQIEAGQLADVAAVVLIDAQHVPAAASRQLADWVARGGAVIADRWPGALDEYGRPQTTLSEVFGIRAVPPKKVDPSTLSLQESAQGYGEITIDAIRGDNLPSSVGEIYQQWDATHPVAQEVGNFMLSGYGLTRVECVAGQVVGMTFGGRPGVVINQHGQGQAMYLAMMLGSLYEGAATRFESDTTHSGMAYHRLLDAFLRFAGAQPQATVDLPLRLRAKVRVEPPLVDPRGNAVVGVTSLNDQPLDAGTVVTMAWDSLTPPRQVLVATGGNRRLVPAEFTMTQDRLTLTLPAFDTHATILALVESQPLVSLEVSGTARGPAGLLTVQPDDALDVTATVYNPSASPVPAGQVRLWVPQGWYLDTPEQSCPALDPWGSATVTFRVQAPTTAGPTRLRPLVVKHIANDVTSTPATELLWWNRLID